MVLIAKDKALVVLFCELIFEDREGNWDSGMLITIVSGETLNSFLIKQHMVNT